MKTKLTEQSSTSLPGTIISIDKEDIIVAAKDLNLRILRLKPENRKEMTAAAFVRGLHDIKELVFS
jgi:methionyl-tRNA formyltransferase